MICICIRLWEEICSSELITSAWLRTVTWKPHKRQSRAVSYCGQHGVRRQKPLAPQSYSTGAVCCCKRILRDATGIFAVDCCLSQTVCSSCLCSHSKSITLTSFMVTNPLNSSIANKPSIHTYTRIACVLQTSHRYCAWSQHGSDAFCKKKTLWKMLVCCFFGVRDLLLGRTTADRKWMYALLAGMMKVD